MQLPALADAVAMTASTAVSQVLVLVFQLHAPPSCWVAAGCPFVVMRTRMSPDESGRAWHWLCVVARASGDAVAELTAAAGRSVLDEPAAGQGQRHHGQSGGGPQGDRSTEVTGGFQMRSVITSYSRKNPVRRRRQKGKLTV